MDEAAKFILSFLGIMGLLFFAWIVTGGPSTAEKRQGFYRDSPLIGGSVHGPVADDLRISLLPKIQSPSTTPSSSITQANKPTTNAEIAKEVARVRAEVEQVQKATAKLTLEAERSPWYDMVRLDIGSARSQNVQDEYLRVRVIQSGVTVPITGWKVRSAITGTSVDIKDAVALPFEHITNSATPVFLTANNTAYLITGKAPKGYSFRVNTCTGYFEQFQDFTPSLSLECPRPSELKQPPSPDYLGDACLDYLEQAPRCVTPTTALPLKLSPLCKDFITRKLNYSSCVEEYRNIADFFKNEWRIYLGRDQELWKERREIIELRDNNGKLVDTVEY